MLTDPTTSALAIAVLQESVAHIGKQVRNTEKMDGMRNLLIEELKHNETCLDMVVKREISLNDGFNGLSRHGYLKIEETGKKINNALGGWGWKKKIKRCAGIKDKKVRTWIGKPADALLVNVHNNIREMKVRYPATKDNPKYNWLARADNCRKRIKLLIDHYGR